MQVVWFGPLFFWTFAGMAAAETVTKAATGSTAEADLITGAIDGAHASTIESQFHFEARKRRLAARGGMESYKGNHAEFLRDF